VTLELCAGIVDKSKVSYSIISVILCIKWTDFVKQLQEILIIIMECIKMDFFAMKLKNIYIIGL
ncbi:MAG: hypothetical protein AAFR37_05175, partial [Cyanobacteria bacterium J06628_3]